MTSTITGMSYIDLDSLEPIPGDLVMARRDMRGWESEDRRGVSGEWMLTGEQAMVIDTWSHGNQRRIRVIRDLRIILFSCPDHVVRKNWKVVGPAPRLPSSCGP